MSGNLFVEPQESSLVLKSVKDKLPPDVLAFLDEQGTKVDALKARIKSAKEARLKTLTSICEAHGVKIVQLDTPICFCAGYSHPHGTYMQTFQIDTWEQDIVPWLLDRDTTMYLRGTHRSGDWQQDGNKIGISVCSRYYHSEVSPLLRLAREASVE